MTDTESQDAERRALLTFLDAQRAVVLAIVDGLGEEALRNSVVPSGWTPLGLIEHLGGAGGYWFQRVAAGLAPHDPWPDEHNEDPWPPFITRHATEEVLGFYRDQCERANAVLASMPLSSPPQVRAFGEFPEKATDVRWIVLHMIEETARHAGQLDIAGELLDGQPDLTHADCRAGRASDRFRIRVSAFPPK